MPQRVLVVDDEPHIVELVRYNLSQEGYEVFVAGDGETALAKARTERPDLIVLDLMLPGLDGLEVCRRLRHEAAVPIIMLTAKGGELERVAGLESGADVRVAEWVRAFDEGYVSGEVSGVKVDCHVGLLCNVCRFVSKVRCRRYRPGVLPVVDPLRV